MQKINSTFENLLVYIKYIIFKSTDRNSVMFLA